METFSNFCIYHYKEIFSTNTEALDLIDKGIFDETVIIADKQTNGRGRTGKRWLSPEGNLYISFIINPVGKFSEFVFITAIAVGHTLLSLVDNLGVQYKWPNDILIDGKKISGVLIERKSYSNWLVIGVGINIVHAPLQESTCISNYCNPLSNMDLLTMLIINFNKLRKQWILNGFYDIRKAWLERAFKLNELISIKLADQLLSGIFTGIDTDGKLILKQENEDLVYFDTGELF
ncbi:biotin--[acetyl-CoA-carboxylase] ligase [Wolbachia pipientis]|uniref:biotin--[biotin carboxyl-carrier protein] ligase n=1 Tax=Wolbachia pipientis TaxID=955 RepID=A0A1E7QLL4_WOLPI|nr:biotin--[acetyl-CoA-carboxylase] ligase [Wolbachia pipientis]OEY87104.1 biotin--[acetyl-CoA-carboxylase] ligase [Wolbachia pipientis]